MTYCLLRLVGFINTMFIPNNKDNQLTNHFMKKTYEHFYGELND